MRWECDTRRRDGVGIVDKYSMTIVSWLSFLHNRTFIKWIAIEQRSWNLLFQRTQTEDRQVKTSNDTQVLLVWKDNKQRYTMSSVQRKLMCVLVCLGTCRDICMHCTWNYNVYVHQVVCVCMCAYVCMNMWWDVWLAYKTVCMYVYMHIHVHI